MDIIEVLPTLEERKINHLMAMAQGAPLAIPDLTHLGKVSRQQRWMFIQKMLEVTLYPLVISHRARDFTAETLRAHIQFLRPFRASIHPLVVYGDSLGKGQEIPGHLNTIQTLSVFREAGFYAGATLDLTPLNQDVSGQVLHTQNKIEAGAQFLVTQLVFDLPYALKTFEALHALPLPLPKLYLGLGPENPQTLPFLKKIPCLNIPEIPWPHPAIKEAFKKNVNSYYKSVLIT